MRYRRIDNNGDYVFGNGQYDFLVDVEAVPQAIKTKIRLFQGEWWEDLSEGLPFYQDIAGHFIKTEEDKDMITRIFCNRIADVEAVTDFETLDATFDNENRKYSLVTSVNTIYGQIDNLEVI